MPSAWAFSIEARTSANRLSTAVASLGMSAPDDRRRGRDEIAVLDREQAIAERIERPRAFAVGPFGGDVADQQAEGAGDQRGEDLLVELGQIEQRGQRKDERRKARRARQDRVAESSGQCLISSVLQCALRDALTPPERSAIKQ